MLAFKNLNWLLIGLMLATYSCQKRVPALAVQTEAITLSKLGSQLLVLERKIHEYTVDFVYKSSLPQLPLETLFYSKIELDALVYGCKKSLQGLFQQIPIPSIPSLKPLKHLDLSEQNIYYLPDQLTQCRQLQYLSLKNNHLQAINPKLSSCLDLKKIDLSSNGFQKIPQGLIHLEQVQSLDLSDNQLNNLPQDFQQLTGLQSLDLSNMHPAMALYNNHFESIPKVLFKMTSLKKLFLEKLALQTIPLSISQIDSLRVLSLNGNRSLQLEQVFETLRRTPQLQALDLSFIGRRQLPSSVSKLSHLKVLIWHEENKMNASYIQDKLKKLLPNTRIYYGKVGVLSPFLRGNTVETIVR